MLNNEQNKLLKLLKTGANMFITGDAGTGKSYTIEEYIKYCEENKKEIIVTAPTGIAAININGVTVHRAFKAPTRPIVDDVTSIPKIFKTVEVIIIDEISMVRRDLFDYIAKIIIYTNKYRRKQGLKDVQVIVVGDFLQLPPVITNSDREVLNNYYGTEIYNAFAFESQYWKHFNFKPFRLTEIVRQKDKKFSAVLNYARLGDARCVDYFNKHCNKKFIEKAINICGRRVDVEDINTKEYAKIQSEEKTYSAKITGEVLESDKVTNDILRLKVGCRIMTLVNDLEGRYNNGSLGTITKLGKKSVTVELDNGEEVCIEMYKWSIKDYKLNKDNKLEEKEIGSFEQFPLKLAYAVTIHKSQGQTYDSANIDPYSWTNGQLYVALSRVRNLDNLHLTQDIRPEYLKASYVVKKFYSEIFK